MNRPATKKRSIECPICNEQIETKIYINKQYPDREKFYEVAYQHALAHAVHLEAENKRLKALRPITLK